MTHCPTQNISIETPLKLFVFARHCRLPHLRSLLSETRFVSHYWGTSFNHFVASIKKHSEAVVESGAWCEASIRQRKVGFMTNKKHLESWQLVDSCTKTFGLCDVGLPLFFRPPNSAQDVAYWICSFSKLLSPRPAF